MMQNLALLFVVKRPLIITNELCNRNLGMEILWIKMIAKWGIGNAKNIFLVEFKRKRILGDLSWGPNAVASTSGYCVTCREETWDETRWRWERGEWGSWSKIELRKWPGYLFGAFLGIKTGCKIHSYSFRTSCSFCRRWWGWCPRGIEGPTKMRNIVYQR